MSGRRARCGTTGADTRASFVDSASRHPRHPNYKSHYKSRAHPIPNPNPYPLLSAVRFWPPPGYVWCWADHQGFLAKVVANHLIWVGQLIGGGGEVRKCPKWALGFCPWGPVVPYGGGSLSRFVLGTGVRLLDSGKEKCAPARLSTGLLSWNRAKGPRRAEQIASLISAVSLT